MSPASVRGTLVSLKEAGIVLGILLGQALGFACLKSEGAWRWAYLATLPLAVVMLVGMAALPPSARWLALRGRVEEAEAALRFFMVGGVEGMVQDLRVQGQGEGEEGGKERLWDPRYRWQMLVGIGVVTLQQITGELLLERAAE